MTQENTKSDVNIVVNELKQDRTDALLRHLQARREDCEDRRRAYWLFHRTMRTRHNWLSIPLLMVSSATGVVSAAQLNSNGNRDIIIGTTVLGVLSAVLTAVQRYCAFSERAENAKLMAKSWSRICRKIENTIIYIFSNACKIDDTVFTKLVEEIQKDVESVAQQADDMPVTLLEKPRKTSVHFNETVKADPEVDSHPAAAV